MLAPLCYLTVDELLLIFVRLDSLSDLRDLVLSVLDVSFCLVNVVVVATLGQKLKSPLSLEQLIAFNGKSTILDLLFLNPLLDLSTLILLLYFLDLHELVVHHLLSIFNNPFSDLGRVNLFGLLAHLCSIVFLLLVHFLTLLHSHNFFVFAFGLDIDFCLFTLDGVDFSLLLGYLSF